ncbi:MAG: LysM peptidoglycan-binding domain-containing protein [Candidatus Zhuqueibacterota bacterium]
MFKFLFKLFVGWLALQSVLGYLRREEIIYGSIEINYAALQRKIIEVIPTEEISEAIIHAATNKMRDTFKSKQGYSIDSGDNDERRNSYFKEVVHVVHRGETLYDLSERYGVSWKVIKKINRLENMNQLWVGQKLRIPTRLASLT